MTLGDLIAKFRIDADDASLPPKWSDAALSGWFAEAEAEAAIRGRLLHESVSQAVCEIAVTAGVSTYPLHAALHEIDYIAFKPTGESSRAPLRLISREELDRILPAWREDAGVVEFAIQSDTSLRIAPMPETGGTIYLEGYRTPLVQMADAADEPEIHQSHHAKLIHWVLHRAFSVPDSEMIDQNRAAIAEAEFTRYFGMRPDADMRRSSTHDTPPHNQAHWV